MRLGRGTLALLAGLGLLAGSAYAVVTSDAFVKRMVRTILARAVRGPATTESASFSFVRGLEVRGLEVRDPGDPLGTPALRVDVLRAEWGLFLGEGGPRVTEVFLDHPHVFLRRRPDGTLSLASILAPLPPATSEVRPPPVTVTSGTIVYEDPSVMREGTVAMSDVDGRAVPGDDGSWGVRVTGTSAELGRLHAEAQIHPGGSAEARVDFRKASIAPDLLRRLALPAADELHALGVTGELVLHGEARWEPGRMLDLTATVESSALSFSAPVPESDPRAPRPRRIPVEVRDLRAKFSGGTLAVESATLVALGATITAWGNVEGLEFEGAETQRIDAGARVEGLVVTPDLLPHFPAAVRRVAEAYGIRGTADANVRVSGPLSGPSAAIEADVRDGRIRYEGYLRPDGSRQGFPWEVTGVHGTVVLEESGRVVLRGEGRHDAARATVDGVLDYATGDERPDVRVVVTDVPADEALRAGLQDRVDAAFDRWGASGTIAKVEVHVHRDPQADERDAVVADVFLDFDGRLALRPRVFPLALRGVTGRVEVTYPVEDGHRVEHVAVKDVRGTGDGVAASVRGTVVSRLAGSEEFLQVEVSADDASGALTEAVAHAAEIDWTATRKTFDALRPRGPADLAVAVRHGPDGDGTRVDVRLRGTSVRGWTDDIPLAVSDAEGSVVVDGDLVTFTNLRGVVLDAPFAGGGTLRLLDDGGVDPDLRIEAVDLPLGEPLRTGLGRLGEPAGAFWERLRPQGAAGTRGARADATVVLRPEDHETPVEIELRRIRGPLLPGGVELDHRDGTLTYDGRTVRAQLDAGIGGADVLISEAVLDVATGDLRVAADVRGLQFPEDLETLLGEEATASLVEGMPGREVDATDAVVTWTPGGGRLTVEGRLAVRKRFRGKLAAPGFAPLGSLHVRHLAVRFPEEGPATVEAAVATEDFRFDPGIEVQRFSGVALVSGEATPEGLDLVFRSEDAAFRVVDRDFVDADLLVRTSPKGIRLDARALLAGGEFRAEIGPGGSRTAYAGELHLRGGALARLAESEPGGPKGVVDGDVFFRNPGGGADAMQGSVEITVREGELVKVPVVSALSAVYPGAGTTTDAALRAAIQGRTLKIRELALRGPGVQVSGDAGTIGLDGTLDFVVRTSLEVPVPIVGPLISGGTYGALGWRVTGTLKEPVVTYNPFAQPGETPRTPDAPGGAPPDDGAE